MSSLALTCLLVVLLLAGHGQVVSGQELVITSSLPAAFFTASSAVNIAEGSVLQLFCTADSSDAVFTWDRGGTVLTNDPPHIRIRSNSDTNTVTSILTVDGFSTADNGAYQCSVGTAIATTQMLTAYSPANADNALFIFRHPNEREINRALSPPADNRTAVVLGATIDPPGTSGGDTLLRCVAAHTNDTGQPFGSLAWIRNGQALTTGVRITIAPVVFGTRYGADLMITNFTESDAGIYQCVATDAASSDSDVATSFPFRLDTDLAGDELRLERVSPQLIPLTPPNKLVIEVKASGRYREIAWSKDGLPFGNDSSASMFVVDRPNELPNFAENFFRGATTASDLGTYTVQLTAFDNATQTRIPDSIEFQVVPPLMFNSASYGNNSALVLTDIGEGGNALICLSDSTQCCRGSDNPNGGPLGSWYFPNGSAVRNNDFGGDIYMDRGASVVRLNRRNNAQSPGGVYRCEARGNTQTTLVDLQTFPPVSPTNLASPSQSPTSITLSWQQPAGDAVDRYDIVYTYQGGCSDYTQTENMATVNAATGFMVQNLQEFSSYTISVAAVNGSGSSPAATAMATTASSAPSDPPQSVMMSSVTSSSITVQWGRVSCIDRNSEITGYIVRYGQAGSTTTVMESVSGTSDSNRTFTASGLIPRTSYTFEVAAVSNEGTGPFSTGIVMETSVHNDIMFQLSGAFYGNNSNVAIGGITEGDNALLCLTDAAQCCRGSDNPSGALGEWYFPGGTLVPDGQNASRSIFRNRGASVVRLNRRNNAQSPTGVYRCEIPDASGTNQTIFIGVNTNENQGAPSIQSVQFELTSATDAATPSFTLDCITAGGTVDFNDTTWTRDGGSSLPVNHGLFQVLDDGSTATYTNTLAVTGRETGQYSCQLQHSGSTTFMDITVDAANQPQDLSAVQRNSTEVQVSWSAPASGAATVTDYVIYYETTGGSEKNVTVGAAASEYTLTGLMIGQTYNISIVALSAQLPSIRTGPVSVTLTSQAPSSPANLASPSQSPTSITLSWEQPAGDVVVRYDIVYTYQGGCSDYTQPENMATVNDGTAREYTLLNLQGFSGYGISIVAINATGVSIPAVILGTTSKEAPSGPPQSVMMSSVTSSSITVQWGRVSCIDRNSEITGYTVRYGQTGSTPTTMESVSGTSDSERMFTASGLIPRTSYTFEVAAVSSEGTGPFSTGTTVETPSGLQVSDNSTYQGLAIGNSVTITCMTDASLSVETIQWLGSDMELIANSSNISLDLVLENITVSSEFVCTIVYTSNETQSLTITVSVLEPTTPTSATTPAITMGTSEDPSASNAVIGAVIGAIGGIIVIAVIVAVAFIIIWRLRRQGKLVIGPRSSSKKPTDLTKAQEAAVSYHVKASGSNSGKASPVVKLKVLDKPGSVGSDTPPVRGRRQVENDTDDELDGNDDYFEDFKPTMREGNVPISVSAFHEHVKRMHADRDKLFELEFESLAKQPQSSVAVAKIPHNKIRNRFGNIFPYDYNRVVLQTLPEGQGTDYINASNINGYNRERAYIAAQGPMHNSVEDFWRMIWEYKLPTIVMLTRCFEGKKKCEQYWPASMEETKDVGNSLSVRMTSLLPFAEYDIRSLVVTNASNPEAPPLKVVHLHYTIWPDHGVPFNAVSLIHFIKKVRRQHAVTHPSPLLVHCSAGVGRTGSFVVLDVMLQRMKEEGNFNIYEFITLLRTQRVYMVQSLSQYMFVHDAIDELITCGETEIVAGNLRIVINKLGRQVEEGITGFEKQFKTLRQVSSYVKKVDYKHAKDAKNASKNRYADKIPDDHNRVALRFDGASNSDYINASFVNGYKHRAAYIATQGPLKETAGDFWKMVWEYESKCVVMLCALEENGEESSCCYWPDEEGATEKFGKLQVTLTSVQDLDYFTVRKLEIVEEKPRQSMSSVNADPFVVTHFHVSCWPLELTPATAALLKLIDSVNKVQMSSGNKAITVICNGGVGRTGAFITVHTQLERLKTEGVVDVFQSLKSARIQRAGLVDTLDQYILCHDALSDYLDSFDAYANFKDLV